MADLQRSEAVSVAYLATNTVHYSWFRSMMQLVGYDRENTGRVAAGGYIHMRPGSGELASARNSAVKYFLSEAKADWMFWVDTDMGFEADVIDRLFEVADAELRPIVGGLCFFNREDHHDGMGGHRSTVVPTIYDWIPADQVSEDGQRGWVVRWRYPLNSMTRVGGTGSACILIHRSVFEKMEEAYGKAWYDRVPNTTSGQLIGEDLSFCLRAGSLGIPVHVHTGVPTTHAKQVWLGEEDYMRQVALVDLAKSAKFVESEEKEES